MDFNALLALMVQKNSFDLFITAGRAPTMKIDGVLVEVSKTKLTKEQTLGLVINLMDARQKEEFYKTKECQFAIGAPEVGRFRVSAFIQRDAAAMVLHRRQDIPDIETLHLPNVIKQLVMKKSGLILFAGELGSGKSTSLNALIKYRNHNSNGHIIVLDDPMEFMHTHARCIVTQREVGIDTQSYETAIKNALLQSPDVVSIGEITSREMMENALKITNLGKLCLSIVYADNAEKVFERILSFFPDDMHPHIRLELSANLIGIMSQKMLHGVNATKHVISEILINTPDVQKALRRGEVQHFKELIVHGRGVGMQSFDQACCDLFVQKKISYEDAFTCAEYKNEFRLMVKEIMREMNVENPDDITNVKAGQLLETDSNEPASKMSSLFETEEITLSDIFDENDDSGSIFTHR